MDVRPNGRPAKSGAVWAYPGISAEGTRVSFTHDSSDVTAGVPRNATGQVYLRDTDSVQTTLVSRRDGRAGDGSGDASVLSDDGSVVLFISAAGNLVRHDDNRRDDAFVVTLD